MTNNRSKSTLALAAMIALPVLSWAGTAEKAKAARTAMLTSRINTLLSITMLYMMVAQQNGGL